MLDCISADHSDREKTNQYILSIQVSLNGFSFLVISPEDNRIVAYQNSPIKIGNNKLIARHLNEWLENQTILKNSFQSVRAYIFSEFFSLIPNEMLNYEDSPEIQSFFLDNEFAGQHEINEVQSLNASLVFSVQSEITMVLNRFFGAVILFHPATKLLHYAEETTQMFIASLISSKDNIFLIIKRRDQKVILANSFPINHPNDLIYSVINTFQQLGISRNQTAMRVAEVIQPNFQPEKHLSPYFVDLAPVNSPFQNKNQEINPLHLYLATN